LQLAFRDRPISRPRRPGGRRLGVFLRESLRPSLVVLCPVLFLIQFSFGLIFLFGTPLRDPAHPLVRPGTFFIPSLLLSGLVIFMLALPRPACAVSSFGSSLRLAILGARSTCCWAVCVTQGYFRRVATLCFCILLPPASCRCFLLRRLCSCRRPVGLFSFGFLR